MSRTKELNSFIRLAVSKYSKIVARTAFSYLKNTSDAEDITQEVFLSLLKSSIKFEDDEHLKAWLIRVTMNKCKNYFKSGWFKHKADFNEDLSYMTEEESCILQAVLSLKEKYRLPIHLYYYEGYSIKEISQILDVPAATIGTRLARGRKELKKIIGEDIYEERCIQVSH